MGNNKKKKGNKKGKKSNELPFVSVCTPTFNRRPFIPFAIRCFLHQDYPLDKMEWIIIDDGTDKIGDLVKDVPNVKYFSYDEKMKLGKKRNLMHAKSKGDIIVYLDDDDYYPPNRVSHAVQMLRTHKTALCAGSSIIHIYFKHDQKVWEFGPYGPRHATAGTFAFKRDLLKITKYNEEASLAEEKDFLKEYTIPFVQLEPKKTILVFSHIHNTFDKRKLLTPKYRSELVKPTEMSVDEFVKDPVLKQFYMHDIDNLLSYYPEGNPNMKPDVIAQTKVLEKKRDKMQKDMMMQQNTTPNDKTPIVVTEKDGKQRELRMQEVVQIINDLQETVKQKDKEIDSLKKQVQTLVEKQE